MKMNYIFDLDGTLIDSMPAWDNIGGKFLLSIGINPPDNIEELYRTMSFEESGEYFRKNFGMKLTTKEMIDKVVSMVAEKYEKEIQLKPHAYDFLKKSYSAGKKMTLLTASEYVYVLPCVKRLGIDGFFENILTCTQLGMSKSDEHIYEYTAEKMNYDKKETVVFEDAPHAAQSAKEAGFFTVGIYDKSADEFKDEMKNMCDIYTDDFSKLYKL
jgi:HAD superfamily hydrolase (TIGR01509 family)